jgi:hypothetical protein
MCFMKSSLNRVIKTNFEPSKSMNMAISSNNQTTEKRNPFRKWLIRISLIVIAVLSFSIYWLYYNPYSKGSRIGKDLKISTKGNIFKTNEGYFTEGCRDVIGNLPIFTFSISDETVEKTLEALQLKPTACIEVQYEEYRRTLPWRGDSKYVIVGARELPAQ